MNSGVTLHNMTSVTSKSLSIVPLIYMRNQIEFVGINKLNYLF